MLGLPCKGLHWLEVEYRFCGPAASTQMFIHRQILIVSSTLAAGAFCTLLWTFNLHNCLSNAHSQIPASMWQSGSVSVQIVVPVTRYGMQRGDTGVHAPELSAYKESSYTTCALCTVPRVEKDRFLSISHQVSATKAKKGKRTL
ncbi:hypothetical protein HAX54_045469 [Datura stramonium]|uniref:Uncharacterized protein n=1 Tax=Datura stramonium TaxID=4076 RepID=A0ABS8SQQ7_DATST|nr:hypothetical protein [Datura stramonium]